MYIERNDYLDAIRKRQWNGRIKVITGLRRSGKSFLLFQMFRDFLIGQGVSERNIIAIALDREENRELTDPGRLYRYLDTETKDSRRKEICIMADSKEYMTLPEENGSINISEEVIAAIAVGAVRLPSSGRLMPTAAHSRSASSACDSSVAAYSRVEWRSRRACIRVAGRSVVPAAGSEITSCAATPPARVAAKVIINNRFVNIAVCI